MCAIQWPNHTAVLSFGPDCHGSEGCTLHVPKGFSAPTLTDSISGHFVCTNEQAPYDALPGTTVCPIIEGNVHAACHPWGTTEADYFNRLNADPSAAQAIHATDADDSRAIGNIVDNVNAEASSAISVQQKNFYDAEASASLYGYDAYIRQYLDPPAP
jgi:hypothetical protein